MGQIAPAIMAISTIAGTALQAAGSIMTGREQARAAEFEKQQYEIDASTSRTAAAQEDARRREALVAAIGTIQTVRAGRGVGMSSPTGMAILTSTTSEQVRDAQQARLNSLVKADRSRIAASMSGSKARYSLISGYLGAGVDIAGGLYRTGKYLDDKQQREIYYQSLRV